MNLASLRKRLDQLDGRIPPTTEAGWRPLCLPEAMFAAGWAERGQGACAEFARHHSMRPDQIVALSCRGIAQAALRTLLEIHPQAEAEARLAKFLAEVHRDFELAGLTEVERGEGERELVDPGIRSWSRKREIDFEALAKLQDAMFCRARGEAGANVEGQR